MSEKYPQAWRDTCLLLLQAHKEEVRKSLGFRRMGWDVIRDRIMRPLDQYQNGEIFLRSDLLYRQNLEAWEKGTELSDPKFDFIDKYVRGLAVSGDEDRAFEYLAAFQFEQNAETLSSIYGSKRQNQSFILESIDATPWAFCSDEIEGAWYTSLIVIGLRQHRNTIKILFAYLPVLADDLSEDDLRDVVFMEGFLIPLDKKAQKREYIENGIAYSEEGHVIETLRCAVKLTRPEYQGLSGIGYADGEIHIPLDATTMSPSFDVGNLLIEYPSPLHCPTISQEWRENRFGEKVVKIAIPSDEIDISDDGDSDIDEDNQVFRERRDWRFEISLEKIDNFSESSLGIMIMSHYAGYIY